MIDVCVIGGDGFVGFSVCSELKKKTNFVKITRDNYSNYKNKEFKIIINAAMPSKRFWAKNNPELDYAETVTKTKNILSDFKFDKIVHISSVSARCQFNTTYGKNKKISEDLVTQTENHLVVRLGPMFGTGLTKGVLMDMLNNSKVYFDGKSKYSFTDVSWNIKWIINNLNLKNQLVEVGATDYIELNKLAKLINSTSEFYGEIDDQIILNKSYKYDSSIEVLNFLKKKKNEI
jgi:nucleoside-diphosphate-sugar epimerase